MIAGFLLINFFFQINKRIPVQFVFIPESLQESLFCCRKNTFIKSSLESRKLKLVETSMWPRRSSMGLLPNTDQELWLKGSWDRFIIGRLFLLMFSGSAAVIFFRLHMGWLIYVFRSSLHVLQNCITFKGSWKRAFFS